MVGAKTLRPFAWAAALIGAPFPAAFASPPPPPPEYVVEVGKLLTANENAGTGAQLANYIASDVQVSVNGKLIANGKADWLRQEETAKPVGGYVLAYSEGWKNGGSLLVVDEYDAVDRSKLPPGFLADPRPATRSTLYQFGEDGKIHAIETLITDGFWIKR
jgi:hypothetical protein